MLVFSTEFPLHEGTEAGEVLYLARTWLGGNVDSRLGKQPIELPASGQCSEHAAGPEKLELARASEGAREWAGMRYSRADAGGTAWVTTMVGRRTASQLLLSLQVSRASPPGTQLPDPTPSVLVQHALKHPGGGMDGGLRVQMQPHRLSADDAAALLRGGGGNRLPLVYLGASASGRAWPDAAALARRLAGLAHVLVVPGEEVEPGTVGVRWPSDLAGDERFPAVAGEPGRDLQARVARELQRIVTQRPLSPDCTWQHLEERVAR